MAAPGGEWSNTSTLPNTTAAGGNISGDTCAQMCVYPLFDLVVNFCIAGLLCLLGLAGNTLSILVLQRERTNRVAVLLLQALAIADNACLLVSFAIVAIFMGLLPNVLHCGADFRTSRLYVNRYLTPLGYMAQTATIWMTVLLAANRYIAICRPFQAQRCLTLTRAKVQVALVALFSVFFNLPRYFQHESVHHPETGELIALNETVIGMSTTFGKIYTNGLYSVLVLLIPFVTLVILNLQLIRELRASHQRMRRNSVSPPEQRDENITFIMIIIIVVFLVCHTPDRIIQIVHAILPPGHGCQKAIYFAQCFCNLLFIVNSSVNFIIYYMFRRRFRNILKTRICGWMGSGGQDEYSVDSAVLPERVHLQSMRNSYLANGNGFTPEEKSRTLAAKDTDTDTVT